MKTAPPTVLRFIDLCSHFSLLFILFGLTISISAETIGDYSFSSPDFANLLFASIGLIGIGFMLRRRYSTRRK